MKRTLITQIEADDWRRLEEMEEQLLDACDNIANSYPAGCSVHAEICVHPLTDRLVSELCNTSSVTASAIGAALETAWTHVSRSLEIAEQDEDPDDLDSIRSDLQTIETAQELLREVKS